MHCTRTYVFYKNSHKKSFYVVVYFFHASIVIKALPQWRRQIIMIALRLIVSYVITIRLNSRLTLNGDRSEVRKNVHLPPFLSSGFYTLLQFLKFNDSFAEDSNRASDSKRSEIAVPRPRFYDVRMYESPETFGRCMQSARKERARIAKHAIPPIILSPAIIPVRPVIILR